VHRRLSPPKLFPRLCADTDRALAYGAACSDAFLFWHGRALERRLEIRVTTSPLLPTLQGHIRLRPHRR